QIYISAKIPFSLLVPDTAIGHKPGKIPIGVLVFDSDTHICRNRESRVEPDFPGVIINHVIIVFSLREQPSVNENTLGARNNENVQFIVLTSQFIRSLIAFLPDKFTFGILSSGNGSNQFNLSLVVFPERSLGI